MSWGKERKYMVLWADKFNEEEPKSAYVIVSCVNVANKADTWRERELAQSSIQWELGVDPWIDVPSSCRTLKSSVVDLDLWLAYKRAHIRLESFPKGTCYSGKVAETKITAGNWIQYKTIDILHHSSRWLIRWFTRNPFQALLMTGAQGSDPQVKGPNSCRAAQARSTGWVVCSLWKASDPLVTWLRCFTFWTHLW